MTSTGLEIARLDGSRATLQAAELETLSSGLTGTLLCPGDEGWDEAVRVWNGMVARRPALVIQPASVDDVVTAIRFARRHTLLISIKGGGHNIAGTSLADGGLTLDMSRMRDVVVDAEARLAHVGPGCLLQDVDSATQRHGLATVLGFISETGVAGLTLGGGLGYLARRFGWTVDSLEEVEVVTADGAVRIANRHEHPDLFWALRGGGGNFGVVTRFTFRLYPVGPLVHGGVIVWPFERADDVLRAYRSITMNAPRELSVWMLLMRAPPLPFIPEVHHGERVCVMVVCYSGDPASADRALAPIRAIGDPIADIIQQLPYVKLQSLLDAGEPKGMHYYWKTGHLAALSEELLAVTRTLFAECPVPEAEIGFLHVAGALNDRPWDDGAVGNRDARYELGVNGKWEPETAEEEEYREWIRNAWARLAPHSTGRSYINFQTADDDETRVRASYGPNFERLLAIKRRYDPDNLFRVNRNIHG